MTKIYTRPQMEAVMRPADVIRVVEEGFAVYSRGEAVIPPVGELLFKNPPGDCHIKYGYRIGDPTFTIKIATGFPQNANNQSGLPASNGVILVFSSQTGDLLTILQDEGFLTDIRTAAAGAVAAKYLAPRTVDRIGIIGAGIQANLQLSYLKEVLPTRQAMVWARNRQRAEAFRVASFEIKVASSVEELARQCPVIVTTTPATHWLLGAKHLHPGMHITAVGADGGGKQEIEPELFAKADVIAVDSRSQCAQFGDSSWASKKGLISMEKLVELGEIIDKKRPGRTNDMQITVADLTGVAIQDIQIAKLTLDTLRG